MNILEQELFRKRETELVDDLAVLGGYIKNFWEILPLPICTTNPIFNILETSEAFNRFFGYFRDELMGDSLERLFVNEEYFKRLTQELFQKKRVADFKTTLRSKIGHTFTVLISAIVRLDENGDTVGYIFSFVDVTFIKQTERELQEKIEELAQRAKDLDESKNALINILEDVEEARILAEEEKNKTLALITNFSDGVLFFDSKNKLSLVNVTAQDFFGIRHNKIIGKSLEELSDFESLKPLIDLIGPTLKTMSREELVLGTDSVLEVTTASIEFETQKLGTLVILHDITREKFVERMKTDFVSIAAHQLRTPLSAIKWIIRMMLDGDIGKVSSVQKEFLGKTYQTNERMIRLVNDLLNVTRIEEGRFLHNIEKGDIVEIISEVVATLQESAKKRELFLKITKPSDEKASYPQVYLDKEKMISALENLIGNGLCYTKKGGVNVWVEYRGEQKEFLIKIQDTGIGIPPEQQSRVFQRFFRAVNAVKAETEGTGLGLFIAKNIIEAHGGRVWFESKENVGSTFFVALPILENETLKTT